MVYRHHAPAYRPLAGDGARLAGGRWNPPQSFNVVYTGVDLATVDAELRRAIEQSRMSGLLQRRLAQVEVRLRRVLDLTRAEVREWLGVTAEQLIGDNSALPRVIGEVAHEAGFEAILAPSAAGPGTVLAIFPDNLDPASSVEVLATKDFDMGAPAIPIEKALQLPAHLKEG